MEPLDLFRPSKAHPDQSYRDARWIFRFCACPYQNQKTGSHPRIESEAKLFPGHALDHLDFVLS